MLTDARRGNLLGFMACLALMGYAVTVFEATRRAGGMAFHGIPDFRLPPSLLDKEIGAIEAMGVEFRFGTPLTRERGLSALRREGFEAVFLGVKHALHGAKLC